MYIYIVILNPLHVYLYRYSSHAHHTTVYFRSLFGFCLFLYIGFLQLHCTRMPNPLHVYCIGNLRV